MQLGRQYHDPAKLAAVAPHTVLSKPPAVLDRSRIPFTPGLYLNNVLPDCTAVGLVNSARAASWVRHGCDIVVDQAKVLALYAATVGCPDTITAMCDTDGATTLDVLNRASSTGIDVGEQVSLVPWWTRCEPGDRQAIADAALYGAAILGVDLAACDRTQKFWDTDLPKTVGDQTPGSWGAHLLILWDYTGLGDKDRVRLGTWGAWQEATWDWVDDRLSDQEAFALAWRQLGDDVP